MTEPRESLFSLRCFVCCRTLGHVGDGPGTQPHGGLTFVASGNYGSRIFDPYHSSYHSSERLHAVICDECVTDRADRLTAVRETTPKRTFDYRPVVSMAEFLEEIGEDV